MAAHQGSPSLGFSRQEHWSGLPFPSPMHAVKSLSRVQLLGPHGLQPTRLLRPWDLPGKSTGVGCHCLLYPIPETLLVFLLSNKLHKAYLCSFIFDYEVRFYRINLSRTHIQGNWNKDLECIWHNRLSVKYGVFIMDYDIEMQEMTLRFP